jgi:hypothetical protein
MPKTEIDVINRAILKNHVFDQEIESSDGTLENATGDEKLLRLIKQFYPESRRQILRVAPWTCVQTRKKLTESTAENMSGYLYAFDLPTDYINQVEITDAYGKEIDAEIEGKILYTDSQAPILTYIPDDANPEHWDPLLEEAICTQTASALAYPITGDHTNEVAFAQAASQMIAQALQKTAREKKQGAKLGSEWFPGLFTRTPGMKL